MLSFHYLDSDSSKNVLDTLSTDVLGVATDKDFYAFSTLDDIYIIPKSVNIDKIAQNPNIKKIGLHEKISDWKNYIDIGDLLATQGDPYLTDEKIPNYLEIDNYKCLKCHDDPKYSLGINAHLRLLLYLVINDGYRPTYHKESTKGLTALLATVAPATALAIRKFSPGPGSVTSLTTFDLMHIAATNNPEFINQLKTVVTAINPNSLKNATTDAEILEVAQKVIPETRLTEISKEAISKSQILDTVELPGNVITKKDNKTLEKAIRLLYQGTKLTTSAGASAFGADTIPDLIFLAMDSGKLSLDLAKLTRQGFIWGNKIYNIEWKPSNETGGGPEHVKMEMDKIFAEIDKQPNSVEIYSKLCESYEQVINSVAAAFASLVAVFIPEDLGISRFIIESVLTGSKVILNNPYDSIKFIYDKIPNKLKDILEDPAKLKIFMLGIVSYIIDLFPTKKDSFWTQTKKNMKRIGLGTAASAVGVALTGPITIPLASSVFIANLGSSFGVSGEYMVKLINKVIVPNIDTFVLISQKILMLGFAVSLILNKCSGGKYKPKIVANKPVIVDKPVIVNKPIPVDKPVIVNKPVEKLSIVTDDDRKLLEAFKNPEIRKLLLGHD